MERLWLDLVEAGMGIHWLRLILLCLCFSIVAGCTSPPTKLDGAQEVPVQVEPQPLNSPATCRQDFVAHELPHTTYAGEVVRLFDSNGAGLAINDLDNDGDLDVVLANLKGENTMLWNEGALAFRREALPYGGARAVNIVDVDGDGWMDILFTRGSTPPLHWRNRGPDEGGQIRFEHIPLPNVSKPAYTMNWGDLDGDGDLDLVTASYDAALMLEQTNEFLFGQGGGVFFYEQQDNHFAPQQLANEAQSLALALVDLNGDGKLDIGVGNDFDMPDQYWEREDAEWQTTDPFRVTSHSTMSFDHGDLDNNGHVEFFATDMKPYGNDVATLAAWLPLMEKTYRTVNQAKDPQRRENVLQARNGGGYRNEAYARGVDATGWSWSAKFGDLDNDGLLDLYAVNGMIAEDLFPYLPQGELVEENQAFRNAGAGQFRPAPEWGLGSAASGRGMSMADLDRDGDLDIVINNLDGPAQLFENQLCEGAALQVDLFWNDSGNRRALGATLTLDTSTGRYARDVRAASGYLSGDPARVHFGFPLESTLHRLEIVWPDGDVSTIDNPPTQSLLIITR
jgi:uncharacterized protein YuzB (UPF0349 family)